MKTMVRVACVALAAAVVAAVVPQQAVAKDKCTMASAQGVGVGPEMGKMTATLALNVAVQTMGAKAKGPVKHKCDNLLLLSSCTASQRACK